MRDVRAFAIQVATKAARNIGGTVRDVLLRTKSQAYLFGSLRRRFPERTEDEVRAVLLQLKHDKDPALDECFATDPRKPTKGREAASDPCWQSRASQLAQVVECSSPEELLQLASSRLRWGRNFTIQTLAAAESAGLLTYDAYCWARSDAVTKAKIKAIRIQRTLPCLLTPEQSHGAARAATIKLLERERLESELKQLVREKKAEIQRANAEFLRLVRAAADQTEERPVECEQRTDYKLGVVEVTRLDTSELIEARELRADEKQLELGATG